MTGSSVRQPGSRLDPSKHAELPWRIAEVAPDFQLLDAWQLPAEGTLEEFADLRAIFSNFDPAADQGSKFSRALFALRDKLGQWLGWDDETNILPIPGCVETSLRERLRGDLAAERDETAGGTPFRPVYLTRDEWALELSNATVHAVLHLAWVPDADGRYRGQLGVYVKPRGWFGRVYMTLIAPFRHWIVYPALMRRIGAAWQARGKSRAAASRRPEESHRSKR
jgi:hypothetical protein